MCHRILCIFSVLHAAKALVNILIAKCEAMSHTTQASNIYTKRTIKKEAREVTRTTDIGTIRGRRKCQMVPQLYWTAQAKQYSMPLP